MSKEMKSTVEPKVGGFNAHDALVFFSFLCHYDNDFREKSDTTICEQYSDFYSLRELLQEMQIKEGTLDEVPNNEDGLGDYSIIMGQKSSLSEGFLYHLRNAIAHGGINKTDDGIIHLIDVSKQRNEDGTKKKSAIGRIDENIFMRILNFIEEILTSYDNNNS